MKSIAACLTLALGSLLATSADAAIVVSFNPSSPNPVAPSSAFSVDIVVSGLGTGAGKDIVSGFAFDVLFSGGVLTGVSAAENAALFGFRAFGPAVVGANHVYLDGSSFETDAALLGLQPLASYTLATFNFTSSAAAGSTLLSFGSSVPFQSNLLGSLDAAGNARTLNASFGTVCVIVGAGNNCSTVPEPESYALVALALVAAGAASRGARSRQAGA